MFRLQTQHEKTFVTKTDSKMETKISHAMSSLLLFDYKSKYIMSQKLSVVHTGTVKLLTDEIRKEK